MTNKKGDVWVSAVLYIALGMVLITLILSAGLPLIEKMRDKNTIVQTKNLLFNINANIETIVLILSLMPFPVRILLIKSLLLETH